MRYWPRSINAFMLMMALACYCNQFAEAQTTVIRGSISDQQTGNPLESANILLKGLTGEDKSFGTFSDRNGVYEISRILPGNYLIQVSFVGYETYRDTLSIDGAQESLNYSVRLILSDEQMGDVEVTYQRRRQNLDAGQQRIRQVDLQRIPTPAGGGDLASYLRTLPGVVSAGDRGGQFFVRGGTPSENLALVDGITIFQPFHIVGFFSVFPEDLVSNVDFYAGGFGPEYASRTSSVLDVRLRAGNFENRNYSASVSPFLGQIVAEGPINKGETSFLVHTRGSLIEQSSRLHPEGKQPLTFNSQTVKLTSRNDKGANCSALAMRTFDRGALDFDGGEVFRWNNFLLGGRCSIVPERGNVSFFDVNMGLSHSNNIVGEEDVSERFSRITKFNLDVNYLQFFGTLELEYGANLDMRWLSFNISEVFQYLTPDEHNFISFGGYAKVNIPIADRISFQPGFRATHFLDDLNPTLEPRLQVSWKPRGKVNERLNFAVGRYLQPIADVSDLRDAGTAFTTWMLVPEKDKQVESIHALAGWQQPIGKFFDLSIEGYHKWLKNVPISSWSVLAQFNTDLTLAEGIAYGSDATLKFNSNRFYASLGYGYSVTEYEIEQELFEVWFDESSQRYNPAHDRRHQLNVQAGIDINDYRVNVGWNYGSGLPFSKPYGYDSHILYWLHMPDVKETYGIPRILMSKPFNDRMPDYHSLSISAKRSFELEQTRLEIQVGSINTYDRNNLFYYDIQERRKIEQLPFYPFLSLKVETK